ncbi:MAG: AAA family ATPase [Bacteroidaceae bacterium]|nr:AAA family ATPase [Bacteroidaceae bacterium]
MEFDEKLHAKFDTVLKFVKMNEPVFMTGAAGCGKNVICKQVAKALGLDFYFTNAVTQEYKLTGFTDASGVYHETQFYQAFKNGGLFMLDEMDASIPEVLVILNAAIANRYFDFPTGKDADGNEVGGFTEAHPDFRVIAAGNTFGLGADYDYVGRNQLDAASLDRFALVRVDYDKDIELSVCDNDYELVNFCDDFRKAAEKAGVRTIVSYRAIGRMHKMEQLMDIKEVLTTCLIKNLQKDDINMVLNECKVSNKYTTAMQEIVRDMAD